MANQNPACGLVPLPDAKGAINTREIPISSSNTKALGINSPYYMTGGEARAVVDYVDGTESVSGTCVGFTKNGVSVGNVPASTGGYKAIVTVDSDQLYRIRVSGTGIADADRGKMYSLTNETMTSDTSMNGCISKFSKRELDSSTEQTSGEQFIFLGRTGAILNDAATDDEEVIVKINPAVFVQA